YHHHRHHHSFPTRRSSDLCNEPVWLRQPRRCRFTFPLSSASTKSSFLIRNSPPSTSCIPALSVWKFSGVLVAPPPPTPPALASRSEEHTSELQSRENLVCR